jgi:hypothetical protein
VSWPPPNPIARLTRPRRRRGPDIDAQQMLRAAVLFVIVLTVAMTVAGGLKSLFLL